VASHKAGSVTNEFLRQLERPGTRVCGRGLHHNPLANERLHVVPPYYISLKDFAGTWVEHRGSHRVGFLRGIVGEHRILRVVAVVVETVGVVEHPHGIFKSRFLEGHVPIGDTFLDIWAQMGGHGLVHVEHDGLHRFGQFATHIGGGVSRYESPASDIVGVSHRLLMVVKLCALRREVPHSPVFLASCHLLLGQKDDGRRHHHGDIGLRLSLMHHGSQFRCSDDAVVKGLHGDNPREVVGW